MYKVNPFLHAKKELFNMIIIDDMFSLNNTTFLCFSFI